MPWVLDLDGVMWLGGEPVPGSADAVDLPVEPEPSVVGDDLSAVVRNVLG